MHVIWLVEPTDCLISEWYCLTNSSTKSQQLLIIFLSFYFLLNKNRSTSRFSSTYWKGGCVFWSPPIYFHTYFVTPMCYKQNCVFPKAEMADVTSIICFLSCGTTERNSYFSKSKHCTTYRMRNKTVQESNCFSLISLRPLPIWSDREEAFAEHVLFFQFITNQVWMHIVAVLPPSQNHPVFL